MRKATLIVNLTYEISIPAFREEGDQVRLELEKDYTTISIPAFREEGDISRAPEEPHSQYFNPRLP